MQRDMPARREEILAVWEAELFWRGFQHLLPMRSGFGWEFASPGTGYGPGEPGFRSMFETNFYLVYGMSIVSALTRQVPKTIFQPVCPKEDADITAAGAANKLVNVIIRNNNFLSLMSDMARFLWTDGRCSFYTRYMKDGQRFGFGEAEEAVNPEEESEIEAGKEPEPKKSKRGDPRGQTIVTVHGALEVKLPVKANCQAEAGWLVFSKEYDLPVAKGMYSKQADKIKLSRGGPAGDDIDRLARVNTKLGVQDNFVTSDSEAYDVTIQSVWLRDCSLLEIKDEQVRDELLEMSGGRGLRFTFCGQEFIEAKQESMDDHWTLCFALPGDGVHRPALGSPYIPVQKIINTLLELRNDYLVRGVPMKFMDNDMFDVEHIKDQTNTPGGTRPFVADATRPASDFVIFEPTIQYPQGLEEAILDLGRGQTAQLMTGVFPALSGDDAGQVAETMGGLKLQRDAALGRIGITWRYIKEAVAHVMLQCVQCLAENHDEDLYASQPKHGADPVMVELQDLKGKFYCEPSTDENFPESWSEIQNRVGELMMEATANPALLDVINSPSNFSFLKKATGLVELVIPKQESAEKQLGEIELMKKSGPLPNPAFADIQQKIQAAQAAAQNPELAEIAQQQLQQLQQQAQQIPPEISSVEVDPDIDDHDTEYQVCLEFLRSPQGRALKDGTTEEMAAYENIKLHCLEHQKLAQKNAEQNIKKPEKGISKGINYKDLVASGVDPDKAVELLKQL